MRLKRLKELCSVFFIYIVFTLLLNYISIPNTPIYEFVFEAFWHTLFCLIIFFVVLKIEKRRIDTLDIYFSNISKQLLWGVGLVTIFLLLPIIKVFVLHTENVDIINNSNEITIFSIIPIIIYNFIFVGFTEELIFRGYLLNRVKEISNSEIIAIIVSSIIFGLCHYPTERDFAQVIIATCMGLLFSYVKLSYPRSCSLFSLSFAHGLYNSGFVIITYLIYVFRYI